MENKDIESIPTKKLIKLYILGGVLNIDNMPDDVQILLIDEDTNTKTIYIKKNGTILQYEMNIEDNE